MIEKEKYYQMAQGQLSRQLSNVDALNAKINTLLIVCGALIVVLGELISRGCYYRIVPGLLFIVGALLLLLYTYRAIEWKQAPNIERIISDLKEGTEVCEFYEKAVEAITECYKQNETFEMKKTRRINFAASLLVFGVFASIIGIATDLFL